MNKKRGLILGAVLILALIVSFYFDVEIVYGASLLRNKVLNDFFLGLTMISSSIIILFFLTSLFLWKENKRKWILPLWTTLGISALTAFIVKITVQRQRPFQLGLVSLISGLEEASHSIWNFSFPSFHAMLAFCAIPILSNQFKKFKYVWIVFAVLVACSRIYFGLHFLSDVLIGSVLGYGIGIVVMKSEKEYKWAEKIYKKIFGK